jgi:hypothetical protein
MDSSNEKPAWYILYSICGCERSKKEADILDIEKIPGQLQ